MKTLHPKIQELKNKYAGRYCTARFIDTREVAKLGLRAQFDTAPGENEIDAYVALFGVKDSEGTVAVKGCFAKSIQERGPASPGNEKIIHLWMHDRKEPIGRVVRMIEDDYGLLVRIAFDVQVGGRPAQIYGQIKSGTVRQFSYGFRYVWDKMEYDEKLEAVLMYECMLYETTSVSILASVSEAGVVRSQEDLAQRIADLGVAAEEFLSGLPVNLQIEGRQLLSQYRTLAERMKPDDAPLPKIGKPDDAVVVGSYKLNKTQFLS